MLVEQLSAIVLLPVVETPFLALGIDLVEASADNGKTLAPPPDDALHRIQVLLVRQVGYRHPDEIVEREPLEHRVDGELGPVDIERQIDMASRRKPPSSTHSALMRTSVHWR